MTSYTQLALGSDALDYLCERLENGRRLLRYVLPIVRSTPGDIRTLLPAGVPDDAARDFRWGGKVAPGPSHYTTYPDGTRARIEEVRGTRDGLIRLIGEFLAAGQSRLCVVNTHARPSHPWLKRAKGRMVVADDEIYGVVAHGASDADVDVAIREGGGSRSLVAVMAQMIEPMSVGEPGTITPVSDEFLRQVAHHVHIVAVGAYDGEGYLVWQAAPAN
jgi:hypothetical protein